MIIQGGRLYRVDDYTGWMIIQGGRLYRVDDYTGWKIIQGGRFLVHVIFCVHLGFFLFG